MFGFKSLREQVSTRCDIGGICGATYILHGRRDCLLAMKICFHAVKRSYGPSIFFGSITNYCRRYQPYTDEQNVRGAEVKEYLNGSDPDNFEFFKTNQMLKQTSPELTKAIKKCDLSLALQNTGIENVE